MEEFLKSKTTWTPLVAGATTTTLTGTLVSQFGLPGNWTGLAISLVFGLFAWAEADQGLARRVLFYAVNALTIFSVAMGLNSAGMAVSQSPELRDCKARLVRMDEEAGRSPFFQEWW